MRLFCCCLVTMISCTTLFGQAPFTIKGVVRDGETNETLPFATVFMAETSYVAVANDQGAYELIIDEQGSFNMVARYAGYEAYNQALTLDTLSTLVQDIYLSPASKNLGMFVVTARHDKRWRAQLKEFKSVFFGKTNNAEECKIVNEKDLDFYFDEEKNVLHAYSDQPLKIINNALGYEMEYFMDDFYFDKNNGVVLNNGNSIFIEMETKSKKKLAKWRMERNRAYQGSVRHFFSALYTDRLDEEGFIVKYAKGVPGQGISLPDGNINLFEYIVKGRSELSKKLFFQDYLYVIYPGEKEEKNYYDAPQQGSSGGISVSFGPSRHGQVSWMALVQNDAPLEFEENGFIYNPLGFFSYGYWSYERVADLVPTNFKPYEN